MTSPTSSSKKPARSKTPIGRAAGRHVLVVEDEPAVRRLLQRVLLDEGYEVTCVGDAEAALARLAPGGVDLVILDIGIPGMDGVALAQRIREESTRVLPVIFLTAKSDPQSMADGIDAGARYYVTKPFSIADLLAKVGRALGV